jgi:hypothetical protein
MTAFDRIERQLPELFDELAAARVPDYFDDMLLATAQTNQRRRRGAIERWLPMGIIARPLPVPAVPWRLIALVAMLAILATATLAYVGSRTDKVPPPFGVARNGALVIGTADGDIVSVDPATGLTTPLLSAPTTDGGPYFSFDGRHFVFDRLGALWIANADGTGARELVSADTVIGTFDWSPDGAHAVVTQPNDAAYPIAILDIDAGTTTPVAFDHKVRTVAWRPNHDEFIVTAAVGDSNSSFWVIETDGSEPRQIQTSVYAISEPTLSPDGGTLAYATWEPTEPKGRIRAVDIDSGDDRAVTTDDSDGFTWQAPQFSPDGTHLLLYRFQPASVPLARVAIMDIDDGSAVALGPENENPQPSLMYSPDGQTILVTYANGDTWMYDADGSNGRQVPFSAPGGLSWQRAALD